MKKAIGVLEEDGVTPEDLLARNLADAAQMVLRQLIE
jgi:hypothetical protein